MAEALRPASGDPVCGRLSGFPADGGDNQPMKEIVPKGALGWFSPSIPGTLAPSFQNTGARFVSLRSRVCPVRPETLTRPRPVSAAAPAFDGYAPGQTLPLRFQSLRFRVCADASVHAARVRPCPSYADASAGQDRVRQTLSLRSGTTLRRGSLRPLGRR